MPLKSFSNMRRWTRISVLTTGVLVFTAAICSAQTTTPAQTATSQTNGQTGLRPTLSPVLSPILTLDSDRLLTESAAGRAIETDLADKSAELAAENRRLEAELTDEEKALTERRKTLSADAFRAEAAAFDEKVQELRSQQDGKLRALREQGNVLRRRILAAADPILAQIMSEAGAAVILERSSVLASANAIDVTALAIARLDVAFEQQDAGPTGQGGNSGFDIGAPVGDQDPVTPMTPVQTDGATDGAASDRTANPANPNPDDLATPNTPAVPKSNSATDLKITPTDPVNVPPVAPDPALGQGTGSGSGADNNSGAGTGSATNAGPDANQSSPPAPAKPVPNAKP